MKIMISFYLDFLSGISIFLLFQVAAHRGYIYVLGGWSIANHAAVERYDVNLNTWTKVLIIYQ